LTWVPYAKHCIGKKGRRKYRDGEIEDELAFDFDIDKPEGFGHKTEAVLQVIPDTLSFFHV
jgi:hypothetical protein